MPSIDAVSIAPAARDWLADSRQARVLHAFDHVCNLINESREVLSIVTPQIGNGPFNLVAGGQPIVFSGRLEIEGPVFIHTNRLILGDMTVNSGNARLWNPRPDWETLHAKKNDILNQLMSLPITNYQSPISLALISALTHADLPASRTAARRLAGLGPGLTPAGDDFIVGAALAAWIIHSPGVAAILAAQITNAAVPLTTSLSAAFLRAAGRGEAAIAWHRLFDALLRLDPPAVEGAVQALLAVGETSGTDALSGFIAVLNHHSVSLER